MLRITIDIALFRRNMISVEAFRQKIRDNELESLLDDVLLVESAVHVPNPDIEHIRVALSEKFNISPDSISVRIVGSAKVGFALTEKRKKDGVVLPRYRLFSPESDIDVAVVSPPLFDLIWNELSTSSHRVTRLPWDSGLLGDYLVCGWLRPDHFPIRVRLRRCDDWWDLFRSLSSDLRYGRRKVRGGLFHSMEHIRRYQNRALNECALAESLNT
jgi:hypothetical protein